MKILQIVPSVSLVYGGPSQMVLGLSSALVRAGAEVILLARSQDRLDEIARTLNREGQRASVYALNLSRADDAAPLIAFIESQHPRIDVIVSNAGKSVRRSCCSPPRGMTWSVPWRSISAALRR